jgi:hypothetical protein
MIPVYSRDSISIGFQWTFRSEGGCSTGCTDPLPSEFVTTLSLSLVFKLFGISNGVVLGALAGALSGLQV